MIFWDKTGISQILALMVNLTKRNNMEKSKKTFKSSRGTKLIIRHDGAYTYEFIFQNGDSENKFSFGEYEVGELCRFIEKIKRRKG